MSESIEPSGGKQVASHSSGRTHLWSRVLRSAVYSGVVGIAALVAILAYRGLGDQSSLRASQDRLVARIGLTLPASKRLDPSFADKEGDLIADAPSDPLNWLDPEEIVVAHYDGDEDDAERVDWDTFQRFLGARVGRPVVCQPYLSSADELASIKAGKIHVVALHAADTPYLVNNAGFVPVAVLGSTAGASGNHLVIAAAAKSRIRSLADVRGLSLTCTRPDSITGYRAAIAVLSQEAGMRPEVDYHIHFSFGQKRSIRGLLEGDFQVASLSADKLKEMLAEGELKQSDYRVIYESQVIPRLTIGHLHSLKPELARQVVQAILQFDNAPVSGAPGAETESNGDAPPVTMSFVPIDYRKDFSFVRTVDDSFDPRIK